jgi:hypothetical protein
MTRKEITKEFDWLIRTAMYAIAGCALIAKGSVSAMDTRPVFIFIGVGLVFLAIFYSNIITSVKLRDDTREETGEKTGN